MKIEPRSLWDTRRRRPNVYFSVKPETEAEKALLRVLYSVRGKVVVDSEGGMMIDFFPRGANNG